MDKYNATKRAGIIGIIGNILLLLMKGIIGFTSGSQAMIADAANSAGDIFASLMTFIGNKIASVPSDEDHSLGHGKAEYIFSMFISISMLVISFKLLFDSANSFINKTEFVFSWFLVVVCMITIIIKLSLFIYTNRLYKKYNNILLKANMVDHRNDCIVTTFTLISTLLSLVKIYWFDGIVGMGISIWICITGIKIFIESYNVLMDISIDKTTKDIILDLVDMHKEIKEIDDFYSAPVGDKYMIVLTICVDGNMSTFGSHKLADDLEKNIEGLDKVYNAIIHVNPV